MNAFGKKRFRWTAVLLAAAACFVLAEFAGRDPLPLVPYDAPCNTPAVRADADALTHTDVTPVWDHLLAPDRNLVWCATVQFTWSVFDQVFAGSQGLHLTGEPPLAVQLNRQTTPYRSCNLLNCYDYSGVFSAASCRYALTRLLETRSNPFVFPAEVLQLKPGDLFLYSHCFVHPEFQKTFAPQSLRWSNTPVAAFGFAAAGGWKNYRQRSALKDQVRVCYYHGPDDFAIELRGLTNLHHRLVLARIAPGATLAATVEAVRDKMPSPIFMEPAGESDELAIPVLNFELKKNFRELIGRPLRVANPKFNGKPIVLALQQVRFELDGKGSKTPSGWALPGWFGTARRLVFDRPFLVLLYHDNCVSPYLVIWVAHPELLEKRP